jgi:hypothetical protein
MLYVGIIIFLVFNTVGFIKTYRSFEDKKILEGIKWSCLTVATTLCYVFLFRLVEWWDFSGFFQFLTATYIAGKAFNLLTTYIIHIGLLKNKEKKNNRPLSIKQSIVLAVVVFGIVGTYYVLTKDYTKVDPMTLAFVEAISYPLLGASIIQKLQFSDKEPE